MRCQVGIGKTIVVDASLLNQATSKLGVTFWPGKSLAETRLLARRCPAWRRREPDLRLSHGTWEGVPRHRRPIGDEREPSKRRNRKELSTVAGCAGGPVRSSEEALVRKVEPIFQQDSYGYRTNRSALDAVARCRERCWKNDWVVDLDIQKFFDSVPWDLMLKAVAHHLDADQRWILLYVQRWLQAPLRQVDGTIAARDRGTPQGSAISPVLANLFMHYAFDAWMERQFPSVGFERYVDDAVVHCKSERQARMLVTAIGARMEQVVLALHPTKTKIVYCAGGRRRGAHEHTAFTFLGYTFRARSAKDRNGEIFTSFLPAISNDALKRISAEVRGWRLHLHNTYSLDELARWINPIVAGWMNYYGAFYKTVLYPFLRRINAYLVRWARKKYKRLRTFKKAKAWWQAVTSRDPLLFAQWRWVHSFW